MLKLDQTIFNINYKYLFFYKILIIKYNLISIIIKFIPFFVFFFLIFNLNNIIKVLYTLRFLYY